MQNLKHIDTKSIMCHLSDIQNYKNIKVAIWWNHADYTPDGEISRAYFINDSEEMKSIFKEYFN